MEKKKMSIQFQKAIMMAFQKVIAEEDINIFDIFESFEIVDSDDGLVVLNPPIYEKKNKEE